MPVSMSDDQKESAAMSDENEPEIDETPPVPGADEGPQDEEVATAKDDLTPSEDYLDDSDTEEL